MPRATNAQIREVYEKARTAPWLVKTPAHDPNAHDLVRSDGTACLRAYWGGQPEIDAAMRAVNVIADLRDAFLATRRWSTSDGLGCWCSGGSHDAAGMRHDEQCYRARRALAALEGTE